MTQLPSRARAIVIGGGITGTSVAYHLAQAGWRDTVLLEKAELTSGSTCHAAGLVTQFNPSPTMMRFRRYSIELYRRLGIFETVGSLRFASSREQLLEQQRGVSRARAIGLDVEVVSPEQAARLMPAISKDSLFGAVWVPGDGAIDPHTATFALAKAARDLGVKVLTGTRVTGIELSSAGAVRAVRRVPFISEAGIVKLVCHPDAMTPDANPLLGPVPGVRGLFMAAGLSLNGFGGAGGIGKSLAELITAGDSELDLYAYRPWRFGPVHRDHRYVAELAREAYRYYYFLRYPYDADEWGRPRRTSALHHRVQDLGAVFGQKHGWERPEHFEPDRPWRRAGADQRRFGWTRPPWFELQAEEHRAFRERVGIIDMTSFGKVELDGPGALRLLERVAGNLIDRPVGSVVYTQLLDRRGGIAGDVTITRLGPHRFRLVTGAGYVNSDLGWLRLEQREEDGPVDLRETTEDLCVVGIWGPNARAVLEGVTDDDVSEGGFPVMQARDIRITGFAVFAQRVTYVGELGWEFYLDPRVAVQVWDRLMAAGETFGIRPGGYRALDSLRMEKGYRYYGSDLTLLDNPLEAGLGFCVRFDKGEFNGREALLAAKAAGITRRLRTLLVGDHEYATIYGGEAVYADGSIVGRVRSCAYGFTVRRNIAYSYLPVGLGPGAQVEVELFGRRVPAEVSTDAVLKREQLVGHDAKPVAS